MEKIGFIGTFDKTDLLIYVSRILVEMKKTVLIIDATVNQKAKYVVPVISPTMSYVTDFEGIDVAVGFSDYNGIKRYLGMPESAALTYDYILIDMDRPDLIENFGIYESKINYFVTSSDLFSLKKGLEVLSGIKLPLQLTKMYFPMDSNDQQTIIENQRSAKIRYKSLSSGYKSSLIYLAEEISNKEKTNEVKKIFKQLEKGV